MQIWSHVSAGGWFVGRWLVVLKFTRRWSWTYRTDRGPMLSTVCMYPASEITCAASFLTVFPTSRRAHPTAHPVVTFATDSCSYQLLLNSNHFLSASDAGQPRDVTAENRSPHEIWRNLIPIGFFKRIQCIRNERQMRLLTLCRSADANFN